MKRALCSLILACVVTPAFASGGGYPLKHAEIDLSDKPSLQRGAKYFVNYCMGCHSLRHLRYNRLGRDLGLNDRMVEDNLIFTRDEEGSPTKVGSNMTIAMDDLYANKVFGVTPPDLTLTARSRGENWIYTYLLSFYVDESRPWGVNNALFPNVGMPNVLWELQGLQKAVVEDETDKHGAKHTKLMGCEIIQQGKLSEQEFERMVLDITNFLSYASQPSRLFRYKIGAWTLAFLLLFAVLAYALKKEYWRDIK